MTVIAKPAAQKEKGRRAINAKSKTHKKKYCPTLSGLYSSVLNTTENRLKI